MSQIKCLQSEDSRIQLTVANNSKKAPQFLAVSLATLIALCLGMCLSWSSSAIPKLVKEGCITESEGAWIGSLLTLGAFLGAIPSGFLSNVLGRKFTLQLMALPFFVSWMMIAFWKEAVILYAARLLAGFAIGVASVAAPTYVAELSENSIRGTLGTFFQIQITIGLLLSYIIGGIQTTQFIASIASSTVPVLFLICFSFMPESPVFLCQQGDTVGARASLKWFRGEDYDSEEELTQIRDNIRESGITKLKMSDLINCKAALKGLIISLGLMAFQQLSGINAVLFYADTIFSESGSSLSSSVSAIIVGVIQLSSTLLSAALIDRLGRRIPLLISASVMCVCLVILGTYFHLNVSHDLPSYLSVLPLVTLGIFIVVFSIGFGPIPWIIMGEIFTPEVKGLAGSLSAAVSWITAFLVTNQYQNLVSLLGIGMTFVIFGGICGVAFLFVLFTLPETKGKSMSEMQHLLEGKHKPQIFIQTDIVVTTTL